MTCPVPHKPREFMWLVVGIGLGSITTRYFLTKSKRAAKTVADNAGKKLKALSTEDINKKWDGFAERYSSGPAPALSCVGRQLLMSFPLNPDQNVLEIACGDGRLAEQMKTLYPGVAYEGCDLSQSMVDLAKKRVPDATFSKVDGENLGYADASFDRVVGSLVLQLTNDPAKMLSEAYRVLKPGGIAAFSIWGTRERSTFWHLMGVSKDQRTSFHLSDNDYAEMKELIKNSQFKKHLMWDSDIAMPFNAGKDFVKFSGQWEKHDEETKAKMEAKANAILDGNRPIVFAITYVVFTK